MNFTASPIDKTISNGMVASNQWANRPVSERFWNVQDLYESVKNRFENSKEENFKNKDISIQVLPGENLGLVKPNGEAIQFNNWAFSQFCNRFGLAGDIAPPVRYLRSLPAAKAADLLNYELSRNQDVDSTLWESNNTALAITSERYARIPNFEVCQALMSLNNEWRIPPARPIDNDPRSRQATAEDVLSGNKFGLSIKEGDIIAPAGVYGDDRSIFVFMVNEERPIEISDKETLYRGFYIQNSEVGSSALSLTVFNYCVICGNHIIWGMRNVQEFRLKHIGEEFKVMDRFQNALTGVKQSANNDTKADRELIVNAKQTVLGKDRDEVSRYAFDKDILGLANARQAYDLAETYSDIHGSPNTIWGFVSGMTRLSQLQPYADSRNEIDRAARKLLNMASNN